MANTIQIKRKTSTGAPNPAELAIGEMCWVDPDNAMYIKKTDGSLNQLNAGGGGGSYVFPIWAEENSSLGNTTYEWAYGNGANTPSGGGIVIPFACELIAMTAKAGNNTGNSQIQIVVNGTPNGSYTVTNSSGKGSNVFGTPLALSANDTINFRTLAANTSGTPNTVCAWFRATF